MTPGTAQPPEDKEEVTRRALREDFERWDWDDIRSEGFLTFVLYRRMVQFGIPIGVLGFLFLAWAEGVPLVDVVAGRRPGLGYLLVRFVFGVAVTMLVAGAYGVWEWRSRHDQSRGKG